MPPRDFTNPTLDPIEDIRRREILKGVLALPLLAAGVSCGDDDEDDPAGSPSAAASGAFPVTIEHAFGSTTISAEPKRVVTVGFTDHDMLLALGVVPTGLRDWYGDQPNGVWPWAQQALGKEAPAKLTGDELDIEAIAALEPDLIIGLYVELTAEEYQRLSQIAPTVAQSGEYAGYATPWQEMTRTAGRALGRLARAEERIAEVEAKVAAARKAHPEFEGKQLVYAGVAEGGVFYVETASSTRVAIIASLGFAVPDEINALAKDSFYAEVSNEQLRLLDHDLVFWELGAAEGTRPLVESNPVYQALDVAREGRHVFIDDLVMAGALAHADVLSIPYFVDAIVPRLAAALDGDPTTSSD